MDVDSDSEMPTAGPSMGKVKHNAMTIVSLSDQQIKLCFPSLSQAQYFTDTVHSLFK